MKNRQAGVWAIAMLTTFLTSTVHAGEWTMNGYVASTIATQTSEGPQAVLKVSCDPEPEVRLLHEALDDAPKEGPM